MSSRKVREMLRERRMEFDRRVAENRKNLEKISEPEEKAEDKAEEKPKPDQAAALLGHLSIQQLQEMIDSTIKAQYEGSSHDSVLYSKPYSKKIDTLKMPRGY